MEEKYFKVQMKPLPQKAQVNYFLEHIMDMCAQRD